VFTVLANQMAIAVENCLSYEELKDTKTQLLHLEKLAVTGKLARAVAHEINNPLAAIKTFTEYLDENYNDQEYRAKFKRIVGMEIERITQVVSELFDLAKSRAPQIQRHVDIHRILDSVVMLFDHELIKKAISLNKNYAPEDLFCDVDPNQIKQCFLNLVLNSMQAFEDTPGPKEITLSTRKLSPTRMCIMVADTGKGISQDNLPKIFEASFTTKKEGHGIGLGIVSDIIKNHHGDIKVESKPGIGTTFTVELPLGA
jgi:signal transduction histidine kinase